MKTYFIAIFLSLLMAGAVACRGSVTETGNVCPGGDCSKQPEARNPGGGDGDAPTSPAPGGECDDAAATLLLYENLPYDFTIGYPDCWDVEEKEEGDPSRGIAASVWFMKDASGSSTASTIKVAAALLGGVSIQTVAANRSPGCALQAYAAAGLMGYRCDLSAAEGIHRQYTLTKGVGVYLFIDADVADSVGLNRMLKNIVLP